MTKANRVDAMGKYELVYMGSPYSKFKRGLEAAFFEASCITAKLVCMGINVYSPIVQTHPIAVYGRLNPLDHSLWLKFDQAIMSKSDAMLIAKMQGWEDSYGIAEEIKYFRGAGRPIYYLDIETMELSDEG